MTKQEEWDKFYLSIARLTAQRSYAADRKVGAIIVKDGNIISFSYNGTLPGESNETCDEFGRTKTTTLHAESQAICKVARSTSSTENATMYTTLSPCIECAKIIVQSGIKRVVFDQIFKYTEGIEFMSKAGVLVNELPSTTKLCDPKWLSKTGLLNDD